MSSNLWRYFYDDDVGKFRQYLATATLSSGPAKSQNSGFAGSSSFKIGSPGALATSPKTPKSRKSAGHAHNIHLAKGATLTRADLNAKDNLGRTLLHHAVSSQKESAIEFVQALLDTPLVDIYAQDLESGWTALHRALYFGNISAANAIMLRDFQNATDYTINVAHNSAGGLVKIKDHEGNSPFETFFMTTAPRLLQSSVSNSLDADGADDDSMNSIDLNADDGERVSRSLKVPPSVNLRGDEVFAFGSNKNLSLGVGDEDDRFFPERLNLQRPEHLLHRLREDNLAVKQSAQTIEDLGDSALLADVGEIPAQIRFRPMVVQDVAMSKFHTAILTDDPISNLYICGFGPGGRLGTADEATSFTFRCIQGGGIGKKRISNIALGQDHTIAVSSEGEVYTWGSNRYGQLGYALPETLTKDVPMQLVPRQLFGYMKKELIIGAAASAIHSVIYTSSGLYTFGKNEGQLGLMDADARSLEIQLVPRRVGVSKLQSSIKSVSAIDRATSIHLENDDVLVFTHYGYTKVLFPLDSPASSVFDGVWSTRYYETGRNFITKVTCGGNTICAMSSCGEVFTVDVPKTSDSVPSNVSTTNPNKAKNALPTPNRVWSIRKSHMCAIDMAVGQDGAVILCTAAGSVWRKEKRANIKLGRVQGSESMRSKDYKFVRVRNLAGAVAVRSNAFGAFMAIRQDSDTTKTQIAIDPSTLWQDHFNLLPFQKYGERDTTNDEEADEPRLRFWTSSTNEHSPGAVKRAILSSKNVESDFLQLLRGLEPLSETSYDMWLTSNVTDVRFPIHSILLKSRSRVMRQVLTEVEDSYYHALTENISVEYGSDGYLQMQYRGADFLTLANLVFYLYTDSVIDVWRHTSDALDLAPRYRSIRTELMKIATLLELRQLEKAVRIMVDPVSSLHSDYEGAIRDMTLFSSADVLVELADGEALPAHSVILSNRCPFFDGLFNGMAGGFWMASRRDEASAGLEKMKVDLQHVSKDVFELVLRHLYADTGDELFDEVIAKDVDEFIDLVIEVMSVANELMIDRLAQICQAVLGRYGKF